MSSALIEILLRTVFGLLFLVAAAFLWRAADSIPEGAKEEPPANDVPQHPRREPRLRPRFLATFAMLVGSVLLMLLALFAIYGLGHARELLDWRLMYGAVTVVSGGISLGLGLAGMSSHQAASAEPVEVQNSTPPRSGWNREIGLGILGAAFVVNALFLVATASSAQFLHDQLPFGLSLIATSVQAVVLISYALTVTDGTSGFRRGIRGRPRLSGHILTAFSMIALMTSAVCFAWPGIFGFGLFILTVLATAGGHRRATQLATLWSVVRAVEASRPVDEELRMACEAARGRLRTLLARVLTRLGRGQSLVDIVCQSRLVSPSAQLELQSAAAVNRTAEALAAAAARETARFSRQGTQGVPGDLLLYVGCLTGVLLILTGFQFHYIVPKLKRILLDFDMEVPPLTATLFSVSGGSMGPTLGLYGFLILGLSALLGATIAFLGWDEVIERSIGWYRPRSLTPALLRGLRWAVVSNAPLSAALVGAQKSPVSHSLRASLQKAVERIDSGGNPWETLRDLRWLEPAEAELLQCAQAAGNLPWALQAVAESLVAQRNHFWQMTRAVMQPAYAIGFGILIGMFGIAMLQPFLLLAGGLP